MVQSYCPVSKFFCHKTFHTDSVFLIVENLKFYVENVENSLDECAIKNVVYCNLISILPIAFHLHTHRVC